MAAPNPSPPETVRRSTALLLGVIALATTGSGLVCFALVSEGAVSSGLGAGLFAVSALAIVVAAYERNRAKLEAAQQSLMASLRHEASVRADQLKSTTANLRVATKVNALLALCAQHMPSGVIITDADGQVLWTNQAWERLSGLSPGASARHPVDELLGRVWTGFERADSRAILVAGQPDRIETQGRCADGTEQWLTVAFQPVHNTEEKVVNFIVIVADITADREMRETLRVAEERLKLALIATDESVWDWNMETGQVYRDRRWSELIGAASREIVSDTADWQNRVHPDDLPAALAALNAHLKEEAPFYISEHRLRTETGAWRWTLDRGRVVLRDPKGRPLRMVGAQGDITARKKKDERLRQSEEIAIQVSRLAQIGAWELRPAADEMRWEPELFRIAEVELGYAPTLARMRDFFPDEHRDAFGLSVEHVLREGGSFDIECPFVTALGRRLWVHVLGRAELTDGRVERLFGAVQDITIPHEAEEAHRRLEKHMSHVQKMETLGTMAGGVAHDFNNLLTGIIGFQDLALDSLAEGHASRRCLIEARQATQRACELVEQILVFSRESGGSERMPTDLALVIEEARRFLRATLPTTIRIEMDIAATCGRAVADANQINQVLLNLGNNAAHAMRHAGGLLKLALAPVEMNATQAAAHGNLQSGDYLRLSVSDTGYGMDAEVQRRIFDPFFTTKGSGEGTGLGLAIVHGIVRGHGGAIKVISAPNQGTTIEIYLPAAKSEGVEPPPAAAEIPGGQGEVIAIVDDEQLVGQATRLGLERRGYNTALYSAAENCLKALRENPESCAVLVSDQTMPGMTGMELASAVRKFAPRLPIILVSGYFSAVSPETLDQIGHIELLPKPFTSAKLAAAVQRALHPATVRDAAAAP